MIDWDEIVEREGGAIWHVCWRLLGNRADADEAFQEAFIAALELSRRQTLASPRAVLQHLATARSIDKLRARQRYRKRHDAVDDERLNDESADAPSPREWAEANELQVELREALAVLPGKQAEAFVLHAIEGWAYLEIAEHLQLTVDHVGVLIHRARAKLKQLLSRFATAVEPNPPASASDVRSNVRSDVRRK